MAISRVSLTVVRLASQHSRAFQTTSPAAGSSLLNLSGLSTSRESQFLSKERGIPRTEFSPHLELIKSSEVAPFASTATTKSGKSGANAERRAPQSQSSDSAYDHAAFNGRFAEFSNARDDKSILGYLIQDNQDLKARCRQSEEEITRARSQQSTDAARYEDLHDRYESVRKETLLLAVLVVLFCSYTLWTLAEEQWMPKKRARQTSMADQKCVERLAKGLDCMGDGLSFGSAASQIPQKLSSKENTIQEITMRQAGAFDEKPDVVRPDIATSSVPTRGWSRHFWASHT